MSFSGTGALVTPRFERPHAHFSRWYPCSTKCPGTYSNTRLTSVPIRFSPLPQRTHRRSSAGTATWCTSRSSASCARQLRTCVR
jgi:hypothetical protein